MKSVFRLIALTVLTVLLASCTKSAGRAPNLQELGDEDRAAVEWLAQQALPLRSTAPNSGFEDLQPLKTILADVRVLGIGESAVGTHELSQMRHRQLEFLVTEMGYQRIALGISAAAASEINDYLIRGSGEPRQWIRDLNNWMLNTEEFLGLLEWIHSHNQSQSGEKQVQLVGIGLQGDNGTLTKSVTYLRQLLGAGIDAEMNALLEQVAQMTFSDNDQENPDILAALWLLAEQLAEQQPSPVIQLARDIARTYDVMSTSISNPEIYLKVDSHAVGTVQDILEEEPLTKMVVWTQNSLVNAEGPGLGGKLKQVYGDGYYALGMMFGQGEVNAQAFVDGDSPRPLYQVRSFAVKPALQGTTDWFLAQADLGVSFINLREGKSDTQINSWLAQPRRLRETGMSFMMVQDPNKVESDHHYVESALGGYDGFIYVPEVNASTFLDK